MKNFRLITILLLSVLAVSGCKKDETVLEATAEEAASIMATSFCTGSAGIMTQMEDAMKMAQPSDYKSVLYDSSFTISSAAGAFITYQYTMNYDFGFLSLDSYQLDYQGNGSFSSPSSTGEITSSGTLALSGFSPYSLSNYYVCNGNGTRIGTFTMKIGNKNSISGTVTTTITDFKFIKSTGICESGTASMVVSGETSSGRSLSFTGTLVYEGNYVGILTLAGKTYSVNLVTGVIGLQL